MELPPEVRAKVMKEIEVTESHNAEIAQRERPANQRENGSSTPTPSLQILGLSESEVADIAARTRKGAGEFGYVATDDLHSHPVNVRIYGNETLDKEFVESIGKVGILEPLIAVEFAFADEKPKFYIVSGHRRWMAAKQLGLRKVPVRDGGKLYHGDTQEERELSLERNLLEANRQRLKTPEQLSREFEERKRIHSALADIRRKKVLKQGDSGPVKEEFPERGQARDLAAKETGIWSGKTAEKMSAVVQLADAGNEVAKNILASINKGDESIHHGYKQVATFIRPRSPKPEKTSAEKMDALAGRLRKMEPPDPPTAPNKTHLTVLSEVLKNLKQVRLQLAQVKNAESPEEHEIVCQILEELNQIDWVGARGILGRTKTINYLVARKAAKQFVKNRSYGVYQTPYGSATAGSQEETVLREFKKFVAQEGWICTGGHNFVQVPARERRQKK